MVTVAALITLGVRALIITALLLITIGAIASIPRLAETIAQLFLDRDGDR